MLMTLLTASSVSFYDVFEEILLWTAIFIGLLILLPQVIALRRNKYADNSSVWIYVLYTVCNSIWLVYQIVLITDSLNTKGGYYLAIFCVQLFGDVIQVIAGSYCIILKLYYSRTKNLKMDARVEKILMQRKQINELLHKQKPWLMDQINDLKVVFPKEYSEIKEYWLYKKFHFEQNNDGQNINVNFVTVTVNFICDLINKAYATNNLNNLRDSQYYELYEKQKNNVKEHIKDLYKIHQDIVLRSNHYKIKKSFHFRLNENEKISNYYEYLQKANLINSWSFLAEIYQNLLSI